MVFKTLELEKMILEELDSFGSAPMPFYISTRSDFLYLARSLRSKEE